MKLKHIQIENFRSIRELDFTFPSSGFLVLVGPNNAGKSNIIRAIDYVCGEGWTSSEKLEDHDFYCRDRQRTVLIELEFSNRRKAIFSSQSEWPEYLNENGDKIWKSKGNIKEDFPCTYLGADRTFDKHLSFYDWTLIGKIRKSFHKKAAEHAADLKSKYAEIAAIYDRMPGFLKFKEDFSRFFREMQADTTAQLAIDFKPFTPSNYFKNLYITATDPCQSDETIDLNELGEGSRNTVLLALLRSYAVNFRSDAEKAVGLLALEEPEVFLHPQARRHLFKVLREIADAGIQVVVSTHSSSFVDTEYFDSIGQVYKEPDETAPGRFHTSLCLVSKSALVEHCRRTGVPADKVTVDNISEFYKTTSNNRLNEAFFARYLVLVEGETEELAIPEYLLTYGIDCDLQGISIIAVGGKNQIPKYWRMFSQFQVPLIVMFDNDDDATGSKRSSNKNVAACFGLTVEDIVDDVDVHCVIDSASEPQTELFILQTDFETALKSDFGKKYNDGVAYIESLEQQARDVIKPVGAQNKGQIARFVARKLRSLAPGYFPDFVNDLAKRLETVLRPPVKQDAVIDLFSQLPETDDNGYEEEIPF